MPPVSPVVSTRISQLDTLRGVAAILVVAHHSMQAFRGSTEDTFEGLAGHLDIGRMGVVIFFMLSGFVIAKAVPGTNAAAAGLFFRHRFWRLYPPFWISIAVAAATAALVGKTGCCVFSEPTSLQNITANLTMIPLRFHQPALIGIYWTLELEMLFYLLIAGVAVARRTSYDTMWVMAAGLFVAAMCVAGGRVAMHGTNEIGKDNTFLALLHLSLMFSGAALRFYWDRHQTRRSFFRSMPITLKGYYVVMTLFFLGVAAIKVRHGIDAHTFRVAATYLLSIVIFLGWLWFFNGSWIGTVLGNRSFGIYLLHLPIISMVSLATWGLPWLHLHVAVFMAIIAVLSLVGADLMRRLVERPAIRFGHRTERMNLARQSAVPAMIVLARPSQPTRLA